MTEKILKTDKETGAETQSVGIDPITGLEMFRRFKSLFSDIHDKVHLITYEEWLVAKDGKTYQELYQTGSYKVVDITDVEPQLLKYTGWFNQLGPVLLPEIANTLKNKIPIGENNYVL